MKRAILTFLSALLLVAGAIAQNNGITGTITVSQNAFTAVAAPGTTTVFRNIGQAAHWLQYCVSGGVTQISIQLEESPDNNPPWNPISEVGQIPTDPSGCGTLEAGGYFQNVRANLKSISGGTVTAWYSASTSPIPGSGTVHGAKYIVPAAPPISNASAYQQAFAGTTAVVNPGAAAQLFTVFNPSNSGKSLYFANLRIASPGASVFQVTYVTTTGTTCSNVDIVGLRGQNSATNSIVQGHQVFYSCTTPPTFLGTVLITEPEVNVSKELDLSGIVIPPGTGFNVTNITAITGTVSTNVWWYEQ